jgi:hypothetical protein
MEDVSKRMVVQMAGCIQSRLEAEPAAEGGTVGVAIKARPAK